MSAKNSTNDLLCLAWIANSNRCRRDDYQRCPILHDDGASTPEMSGTAYPQSLDILRLGCENSPASSSFPSLDATATLEWGCIGKMGWRGRESRLVVGTRKERRPLHQSPALPGSDWKRRRSKEATQTMMGGSTKAPSRSHFGLSKVASYSSVLSPSEILVFSFAQLLHSEAEDSKRVVNFKETS
jgi:hypothetical protein